MDEDLKIVLTSELEADEEASAQRISAQLPNIAKLINSKSNIKVGVTLDEAGIQSQTQRITQQIARATKSQSVGVSLSLDQSSVNKIKTELNNLKVSPDISRAMTDQLDQMGIQIDRITGRWEAVNGEEERMLNLTIQGTDQMQRTVTYLQTYNAETGEINTHLTNVTANLERQRREQEQVAAQAKKDNESRVSYLNRQKALLADIQAAYVGQTSVKPITDSAHLTALNDTYAAVNARIETMIAAEGRLDNVQRSNLEAQISGLQRLVKEYQNAEYVATKLRTKDIGSIKADQLSGLEALEKRLESAGTLTDTFKSKIDGLKKTLQGVGTKDQLVAFLNSFDQLNNDVAVFQERLRGANKIYTQLISLDKQITSVQSSMTKLNTSDDKNKLLALQGQLSVLNNQRAALEAQLVPYADIIQYAKQATALEQSRLLNGTQLVYTQMELADKARDYDVAMQSIPSTIADLQTKFSQVVAPTENLVQNMRLLRETAAQYGADMGDREKVTTYERLQSLIGACSKEMSELLRVQRGDVNDFKFTQNLEKAKADLETVGRTWSALKQDPGLNAQFQQLSENLKRVDNQTDLRKWTAQFSTFKSEVKAAGKNMQSLGDILKNNVGKVLQWVSATTLLFRAFRLLRSALTTIVDLDTAMIDLQKVTTATREEYDRFYHSANGTAKALGVTTEEVISQTAEWARLGYAMQDAAKLAENSAIFEAISPDMDITQATDGLVSIIKAYDLDVEDSLDGIISKVNEVGNKFAVSNGDIVEAMTRSSAAMAAANNTFEETVALATAAIEITRDAATVGNGLKTLSMRIRGYDEETEEYSADVSELTGTIADLTKVASNNNRGISLFEADDPETYRSTYDILSDIADIWDELTDKNRANLLEALFGKRQAQIGAAILSNFDQARSAIVKMEESAGSAGREMDKITQSLDYKLNALKETWVGVAQNLFQTDDMKLVVDALNLVSNGIDQLTEKLGLFGTIGLVGAIALIYKFRAEMNMLTSYKMLFTEQLGIYILQRPATSGDGVSEVKHITGYSIEQLFEKKKLYLEEGTYNFWNPVQPEDTILGRILELDTTWSIGYVDPKLIGCYRTFDEYDSDALSFCYGSAMEKYNCTIVFDVYARTISAYDAGKSRGTVPIYLSYQNLVDAVDLEELTDDMVTKLHLYGSDDLSIRDVNPIGTDYMVNLSYFISNGDFDVIAEGSTVTLAERVKSWNAAIKSNQTHYTNLVAARASRTAQRLAEEATLASLKGDLEVLTTQQSVIIQAMALESTAAGKTSQQQQLTEINEKISAKNSEIEAQETVIANLQAEIDRYTTDIQGVVEQLSISKYFTKAEQKILNHYLIEGEAAEETFVATDVDTSASGAISTLQGEVTLTGADIAQASLNGKSMYAIAGGVLKIASAKLTADIVRGTLEVNPSTNEYVLTVYMGSTTFDEHMLAARWSDTTWRKTRAISTGCGKWSWHGMSIWSRNSDIRFLGSAIMQSHIVPATALTMATWGSGGRSMARAWMLCGRKFRKFSMAKRRMMTWM